ncbi:MAG: hypothetical protein GF353_15425 [Candidatus Lokiarchaeota archaeon]|nr:hypothetical protein [Candidatus Lokiarchaeota archaeon]
MENLYMLPQNSLTLPEITSTLRSCPDEIQKQVMRSLFIVAGTRTFKALCIKCVREKRTAWYDAIQYRFEKHPVPPKNKPAAKALVELLNAENKAYAYKANVILNRIKEYLSKDQKEEYFWFLMQSRDIQRACKIAPDIWSPDVENVILDFANSGYYECVRCIVDCGDSSKIELDAAEVWRDDPFYNREKMEVIRVIASQSIEKIRFLQKEDMTTFIYAATFSPEKPTTHELEESIQKAKHIQDTRILIWSLEKLGRIDLLRKYLSTFPLDPEPSRRGLT